MVWNILVLMAMLMLGGFLYSFCTLPALICLFCAYPLTHRLRHYYPGQISVSPILLRYTASILLLGGITAAVSLAVFHWGNEWARYGFLGGAALAFLFSLGRWGRIPANVGEYLQSCSKHIEEGAYNELLRAYLEANLDVNTGTVNYARNALFGK